MATKPTQRATPEEVLTDFLIALGEADCERAIELSTGEIQQTIQGTLDIGCEAYEQEFDSVSCEIIDGVAQCSLNQYVSFYLYESDDDVSHKQEYTLRKVNGDWKVAEFVGLDK